MAEIVGIQGVAGRVIVPCDANAPCRVVTLGCCKGARPYTDRKIKIERLPAALDGLTLLQTSMAFKTCADPDFHIQLQAPRQVTVLLAVDERMLAQWERSRSTPAWFSEQFGRNGTPYRIVTDDKAMAAGNNSYLVFAARGVDRIDLGAPSGQNDAVCMYFAMVGEEAK